MCLHHRAGVRDLEQTRKMVRSTLADAFDKVLAEPVVSTWNDQIQLQIFSAVLGLLDLAVAKLSQLRSVITTDAVQALEDETDLVIILECVQQAFDVNCIFNVRNQDATVPSRLLRAQSKRYACPQPPETSSSNTDSFSPDVDDCQQYPIYSWPAYFINYFGHKRGFHYIQQVPCLARCCTQNCTCCMRGALVQGVFCSPRHPVVRLRLLLLLLLVPSLLPEHHPSPTCGSADLGNAKAKLHGVAQTVAAGAE